MKLGNLKRKRWAVIAVSVGALLVVALLMIWYLSWQASQSENDPYLSTQDSSQTDSESETGTSDTAETGTESEADQPTSQQDASTVDPAKASTVDITPMGVTVSYVRGVPGFEYVVKQTQNGTKYVEFSSSELAGKKCTGDTGTFASIIENPEAGTDSATVTSTVKVGENNYGLSLPAATCTQNPSLFARFQDAFKDAFGLLKPLSATADASE